MLKRFLFEQFYLANAAIYPEKHLFYGIKRDILVRHGIPDGYDLQILDRHGWNGNPYQEHNFLARYRLGDRVYHSPVYPPPNGDPVNTIFEKIQHQPVPREDGRWGLFWLLVWQNPLWMLSRTIFFFNLPSECKPKYLRHCLSDTVLSDHNVKRFPVPNIFVWVATLFSGWKVVNLNFNDFSFQSSVKQSAQAWEHFEWVMKVWLPDYDPFDEIPF